MKTSITVIIILALAAVGIYFYKYRAQPVSTPATTTQYTNPAAGVSFTYPKTLTASTTGSTVALHHDIPFAHADFCDFKGDAPMQDTLTDFHVAMHVENLGLVDAMKKNSPYIPQENFVGDTVVASPGFIDPYTVGSLQGYMMFEGVEGCGRTLYYLPLSSNRTLVVDRELVTVFSGAINSQVQQQVLAVPGVITKEKADEILKNILVSLKTQ